MTRKLGSIGILVLVVAMAVVLVLVARSWSSVAPTAAQIRAVQGGAPDVEREEGTGTRDIPDLGDMKKTTEAHADDVRDAMAAIE